MIYKMIFQCFFIVSIMWMILYRLTDWVNPENLYLQGSIFVFTTTILLITHSIESLKTK